jgi:hypothetical protein
VREFLVPLALCTVCFHDLVHVFKSKCCVCDYVYNVYLVCELDLYLYLIVIWLKKQILCGSARSRACSRHHRS